MKLYMVGKDLGNGHCEIQGIFSTEELAVSVCVGHINRWVGPLLLDEVLPDEAVEWTGAYFPYEVINETTK